MEALNQTTTDLFYASVFVLFFNLLPEIVLYVKKG